MGLSKCLQDNLGGSPVALSAGRHSGSQAQLPKQPAQQRPPQLPLQQVRLHHAVLLLSELHTAAAVQLCMIPWLTSATEAPLKLSELHRGLTSMLTCGCFACRQNHKIICDLDTISALHEGERTSLSAFLSMQIWFVSTSAAALGRAKRQGVNKSNRS